MAPKARGNQNFPGDSECNQGLVTSSYDYATHVCLNCNGLGCKPRILKGAFAAKRAELLRQLSGSYILADQKGRAVYVDLDKGTAHVVEGV